MKRPEQVTELLQRWKLHGDRDAENELFTLVQTELVKIARRALGGHARVAHKIDPTELVSEAYLSLRDYPIVTANRAPFFVLMARAMRHFLIDLVRSSDAEKRPPTHLRVTDTNAMNAVSSEIAPLEFYRALDALRALSSRQADTIELRVIGLTNEEIAEQFGMGVATVKRDLAKARAFLAFKLGLESNWIQT